ncbi:MAG: PilZ domain-containing protein, partial [Bdellovibrionota bacterium]
MSSTEKSPAPRTPLKLEVEYRKSYGRSAEVGELKNISITGAFLEHTNEEIKMSDKVAITFQVGGRTLQVG